MIHNYASHIFQCYKNISKNIIKTPLQYSTRLSDIYNSNIYLKREDLQITRSFKIRGATNKIMAVPQDALDNGVVCASAGNHAQGFAHICKTLNIKGDVFLPETTPLQKINRINYFGGNFINIHHVGKNFNQALDSSFDFSNLNNKTFIHPFDDLDVIDGQATIGYELLLDINPDIIIVPCGGGGLISGISKYMKNINDSIKIIGVEPKDANSLQLAMVNQKPTNVIHLDTFVDGASVGMIGKNTFEICRKYVDDIYTISNEKLCHEIVNAYQEDGIILEPAGALSLCVFDELQQKYDLNKKNVICILSGGNNDMSRYDEIMELNSQYLSLRHYFIIEFSQSPGQLKLFINKVLGPSDDIIRFEYIKKTNKNYGKVLIGLELNNKQTLQKIIDNLDSTNFKYQKINASDLIYDYLI